MIPTRWIKQGTRWALALLVGTILFSASPAQAGKSGTGVPQPKYTEKGVEACTRCHSGETMRVMEKTAHGDKGNPASPYAKQGCESCHGPGSIHISRAHGGVGFPLMVTFGAGKRTPMAGQIKACLDCHAKATGKLEGMRWRGSAHDGKDLSCSSCHKMHSTENPIADKKQQAETCFKCHAEQKTEHRRFENKGIVFDELSCWDCHDVHQLSHNRKAAGNKSTGSQ